MRRGAIVLVLVLGAALLAAGCTLKIPAAERGAELFSDPRLSDSMFNRVSCATCHQTSETPDPARIDAGYRLWGVAARERTWGGQTVRLLDAVNTCYQYFMRSRTPLDPEDEDARALYEYLLSITPDDAPSATLPMTVVENVLDWPRDGDPARGAAVYDAACRRCHGAAHTGEGTILDPMRRVILPAYTAIYEQLFPGVDKQLVVTEKVRHGRFFSLSGEMPFYSLEALSDAELADLLAFLFSD